MQHGVFEHGGYAYADGYGDDGDNEDHDDDDDDYDDHDDYGDDYGDFLHTQLCPIYRVHGHSPNLPNQTVKDRT